MVVCVTSDLNIPDRPDRFRVPCVAAGKTDRHNHNDGSGDTIRNPSSHIFI